MRMCNEQPRRASPAYVLGYLTDRGATWNVMNKTRPWPILIDSEHASVGSKPLQAARAYGMLQVCVQYSFGQGIARVVRFQ
jgi:hypothetical protein